MGQVPWWYGFDRKDLEQQQQRMEDERAERKLQQVEKITILAHFLEFSKSLSDRRENTMISASPLPAHRKSRQRSLRPAGHKIRWELDASFSQPIRKIIGNYPPSTAIRRTRFQIDQQQVGPGGGGGDAMSAAARGGGGRKPPPPSIQDELKAQVPTTCWFAIRISR